MFQCSIPPQVEELMQALESRGFEAWAVGGCVRDALLGLTPHDWDLCSSARPEELKEVFSGYRLILAGEKHGTVAVLSGEQPVEITTFRSEGDYLDNRHPGWVRFERDIRQDLARRDFTVNAMAYSPRRGLADPWNGRADLEHRVLRAVGMPHARFREDGLRILRGVRFAARYHLTPEPETLRAMEELAHTLSLQARERVFTELCGFLQAADVPAMAAFRQVLVAALPELGPLVGFWQHNPHHIYDIYTHTAHVVAGVGQALALRWAALLHDVAKPRTFSLDAAGVGHFYGHASQGAELARGILQSLRAPRALTEQVVTLISNHGITRDLANAPTDKPIRRLLSRLGEQTLWQLLELDQADDGGKGTPSDPAPFLQFRHRLEGILAEKPCLGLRDLALGGRELMAMGIPQGPEMGRILNRLLDEVLEGSLENSPRALSRRAGALWQNCDQD